MAYIMSYMPFGLNFEKYSKYLVDKNGFILYSKYTFKLKGENDEHFHKKLFHNIFGY